MQTEIVVKLHREQREHRPEDTPHHRVRCERTSREKGITIDEVHVDSRKDQEKSASEWYRCEDGYDPMDVGCTCPREDEETDREHDGAGTSHGKPAFGRDWLAGTSETDGALVPDLAEGIERVPHEETATDAEESEARDTR